MDPIIIYTSIDTKKNANKLAKKLVENSLAACVNIVPIKESIYNWDGEIKSDPEFQLIIKTDLRYKSSIEKFIKRNHSYELPEIMFIKVSGGSKEYLDWISNNLNDSAQTPK